MFAPATLILSALIGGNKLLAACRPHPKFNANAQYWQSRLRMVALIWAVLISFLCIHLSVGLLHCVLYDSERSVLAEDMRQFCFSEIPASTPHPNSSLAPDST